MSNQDILSALKGLVLVCGSTGDSFEDFEEQAAAFHRETGYMRPGKDMSAASGGEDDHELRQVEYFKWTASKVQAARDAIASSVSPECCKGLAPPFDCACVRWDAQEAYARERGVKNVVPHPFPEAQ